MKSRSRANPELSCRRHCNEASLASERVDLICIDAVRRAHENGKTKRKRSGPASIPFDGMKGRDLEECVYWILDAMGARDWVKEWQVSTM